jgi:hypothetical protein
MSGANQDTEGLIIAWGLMIMLICFLGGFVTGQGPIEFFVIASFWVFSVGGIVVLIIALTIAIVKSMRESKNSAFGFRFDDDVTVDAFSEECKQLFADIRKAFSKK